MQNAFGSSRLGSQGSDIHTSPDRRFRFCALAGVAVVAFGLAGCSDITRFGESPLFTASTPNQQQIYGNAALAQDQAMASGGNIAPMRAAAVTSAALPPPVPVGQAQAVAATATQPLPAPTQVASAATSAVAAVAPNGAYKGWSAVGGSVLTAAAGDTPSSLAQRYGVPVDAIMSVNGLSDPYGALGGRRVTIPTLNSGTATQVATAAASAIAKPAAVPAGGYAVTSGETLYSVARKFQISPAALAAANGLTTDSQIKIGQNLQIPAGAAAAAATATKVASVTPLPSPMPGQTATDAAQQTLAAGASTLQAEAAKAVPSAPAAPAAPAEQKVASLPSAAGAASKAATDAGSGSSASASAPEEEAGSGFRWPVRGRIIAGFGKKSNGEQNDGINIAVPEGTPVKAAEAGTVIYAGNELSGFGNLVLVRHEGGWVTAYAHNKELLVRRGETVKRGQTIGYAGATGSVSQPQVHFELRKGSQPVDPLPHLAGA